MAVVVYYHLDTAPSQKSGTGNMYSMLIQKACILPYYGLFLGGSRNKSVAINLVHHTVRKRHARPVGILLDTISKASVLMIICLEGRGQLLLRSYSSSNSKRHVHAVGDRLGYASE